MAICVNGHSRTLGAPCNKCLAAASARWRGKNLKHKKRYEVSKRAEYRRQWIKYFKEKYGSTPRCQLCEKTLYWTHKRHGMRACFDHRRGGLEPIKDKSPRTWIQNKPLNEDNMAVFNECDFGILCRACNILLPASLDKRNKIAKNLLGYLR